MHNRAFAVTGRNAVYLAFETEDISGCIRGMKALGIKGLSITIPHKSSVMPLLDEIDPLAKRIGAVNTIVNRDSRLTGYNTDALGALRALEEKTALPGKHCLLVGAGGAARAIAFVLKEQGVHLTITNRTVSRGEDLAEAVGCPFVPLDRLGSSASDILVHTTSVGMHPHENRSAVPETCLREGMIVMDVVYNPLKTRLLSMAEAAGCITVSGLGMFIGQGTEQFRLWTGLEAPVTAMTEAVMVILGGAA
jgi:shikimate dehydrogenase